MKKVLFFVILSVFAFSAFGQVSVDPDHVFYTELERWEALGLVAVQNQLRPYPLGKIKTLLETVMAGSSEVEAERAAVLYSEIFGKAWKAKIDLDANLKFDGDLELSDKEWFTQFGVDGDVFLGADSGASAGFKMDCLAGADFKSIITPEYSQSPLTLLDAGSLGDGFYGTLECDGAVGFEYGNIRAQAGINHLSFGPFLTDGLAISNNARHSANFSLSYDNGFISFNELMMELSATSAGNSGLKPDKFLMMHNLTMNLTPWVSVTFYETSIFGKRFDPAYFIPMLYIVTEGVTGFDEDNILMGGSITLRPFSGLIWKIDGYLDDVGFTKIREGNIKLLCSGRTGVIYVPQNISWFKKIGLDYTMITPYMYTHAIGYDKNYACTEMNYQIYTSGGKHLATALEPNSDRISFSVVFEPVSGLNINMGGNFIRHGNVNETLSIKDQLGYIKMDYGYQRTDGSIDNHFIIPNVSNSDIRNQLHFLTQDTIEYTLQLALGAEYSFKTEKAGTFGVAADYTFEYIWNKGVGTDIFTYYIRSGDNVADAKKTGGRSSYGEGEIADAISIWKSKLKDVCNNYLSVKLTWRY